MDFESVLILNAVTNIACIVAGYYLGHRGFAGVALDLHNIKADVTGIKNKLTPITLTPVTVPSPVVSPTFVVPTLVK